MRYLSEDGRLFNTAEECIEHEKGSKQPRINEIKEKWEAQEKLLDELDELIDAYIDDFPSTFINDLNFILKDMKKPEEVEKVLGTLKEIDEIVKGFKGIK